MATHFDTIRNKAGQYNADKLESLVKAAKIDEERNANLFALLTAPSSTSGLTSSQKNAVRDELLKSLGVTTPNEED